MIANDQIGNYYKNYIDTTTVKKTHKVKGFVFQIDEKYEVLSLLGQGAYGAVIAARDMSQIMADQKGKLVAIKKIEKAFDHKLFSKRTLRELKILRLIKGHENIIQINDILLPRSRQEFNDMSFIKYIVQELMETDLHQIIRSPQPLLNEHCQFFLYQILRSLKYIHSAKIIHRDLICDFGLARCFVSDSKYMKYLMYTGYVATRWYRAPELILSWQEYDSSVDVWSVGCIFAELLRRQPLFPGKDTNSQLKLIIDVLGTPSEEEITNTPLEKYRHFLSSIQKQTPKKFEPMFPKASSLAIDLLKKMLVFNPLKRITIDECLNHEYLAQLHLQEEEPVLQQVSPEEFEFEYHDLTIEQIKNLIYEEILLYHYPDFQKNYENKILNGQSVISHIISFENNSIQENEEENDVNSDDDEEFIAEQIRTFLKDKDNFSKVQGLMNKK